VDRVVSEGARVFIAGDDDQSIYSFRSAAPAGLAEFVIKYPNCGQHTLNGCFRCTPTILAAGHAIITSHPQPNRIPKALASLYLGAAPPLAGTVHLWRFSSGKAEARAVAESCRDLIAAGINPREILVLLGNKGVLLPGLVAAFDNAGVEYEPPRAEGFLDSRAGRWVLAAIRIVCDPDDYVAHRVLLGLRSGVGVVTCTAVTDAVIASNLNYKPVFYQTPPAGVFSARGLKALNAAGSICSQLRGWQSSHTVDQHLADISSALSLALAPADAQGWRAFAKALPAGMTLGELRDLLWADTDEQQGPLLQAVLTRLGLPVPATGVLPPRVRVMTMHGAKGLSGKIVFVPGLEEEILPGAWRRPYPGLVLEAARLLYVSITRARAACIISYTRTRVVHGAFSVLTPSRFTADLGGAFLARTSGLEPAEVGRIISDVSHL